PALLLGPRGRVAPANAVLQTLQGEQAAIKQGQVAKAARVAPVALRGQGRASLAGLGHQDAATCAAPAALALVQYQQAAAFAFGGQPQAFTGRVDDQALEQGVVVQ